MHATTAATRPPPPEAAGPAPGTRTPRSLRAFGPQWYASVMGTAIVANGAAALPVRPPGLRAFGFAVWALSFVLLGCVIAARVTHIARHRGEAKRQLLDEPSTAFFYGCPPMALLAVGHGTLLYGPGPLGTRAAVTIDAVLWSAGAAYAVAVACGIPYLMITRWRLEGGALPGWLLPVVAPMVAAALGPPLVPHLPPGQAQTTLLYACLAMFGASLLGTLLLLPGIWTRLTRDGLGPAFLTPTLFLVLGPLGQSTTAVKQFADAAATAAPGYAGAMRAFVLLYGVPVLGFALMWLIMAGAANVRALRRGMPFAMTWWAWTFPVGTCVTGAAGLARHTGLHAFIAVALALYVLLTAAWAVVAARTVHGAYTGRLLS
ncbi:TDT family transporter [Actinomadura viridis]|uniref:TDT family transporter n=1 Tax=Actinomadura viridis TaxID=58110 RepID=UPI0036A2D0D8